MTWYETFDSVFWITLTTILTGSVGLALKYCLKSKCRNLSCCWGLVHVDRDVDIEAQEEMKEMELQGVKRSFEEGSERSPGGGSFRSPSTRVISEPSLNSI